MKLWLLWIRVPFFVLSPCPQLGLPIINLPFPQCPQIPSPASQLPAGWQPRGCGCFWARHVLAASKLNIITFELRQQPFSHGNNLKEVVFPLLSCYISWNLEEFHSLKFSITVSDLTEMNSWIQKLLERVWQDGQANSISPKPCFLKLTVTDKYLWWYDRSSSQ